MRPGNGQEREVGTGGPSLIYFEVYPCIQEPTKSLTLTGNMMELSAPGHVKGAIQWTYLNFGALISTGLALNKVSLTDEEWGILKAITQLSHAQCYWAKAERDARVSSPPRSLYGDESSLHEKEAQGSAAR